MRALLGESGGGLQAGVVGANDLKVAQRGAGANMSVDVPAGAAWVAITSGTRNGLGHVYNDATANVTVTASNATNPRIDSIILRWNDSSIPTGSGNVPTLEVATGTATAGATLDNRTGAATPTGDFLRLADMLVPATSTSVVTANIRDRRPWARGFYYPLVDAAGDVVLGAASVWAATSTTRHRLRVECSGVPLRIHARVRHTFPATLGAEVDFAPFIDGAVPTILTTSTTLSTTSFQNPVATADDLSFNWVWEIPSPTPGTHLIDLAYRNGVGFTLHANATLPLWFIVEEIVRQQANNGTA
jgi:hypothetical protein